MPGPEYIEAEKIGGGCLWDTPHIGAGKESLVLAL